MKKQARLKALWAARLANQMTALSPFDQVFREFRRALRQSGLPQFCFPWEAPIAKPWRGCSMAHSISQRSFPMTPPRQRMIEESPAAARERRTLPSHMGLAVPQRPGTLGYVANGSSVRAIPVLFLLGGSRRTCARPCGARRLWGQILAATSALREEPRFRPCGASMDRETGGREGTFLAGGMA